MNRYTIAVLVRNQFGVLNRVTSMFRRRQFNISALTVSETESNEYSRITVVFSGEEVKKQQLVNQLKKLHNVKRVKVLESETSVERELMLIKVRSTPENRSEVMAAAEIYRAKIIDYNTDAMCVEVTGEPSKIKAFIEVMKPLGILEMCRTGAVALERGDNTIDR